MPRQRRGGRKYQLRKLQSQFSESPLEHGHYYQKPKRFTETPKTPTSAKDPKIDNRDKKSISEPIVTST